MRSKNTEQIVCNVIFKLQQQSAALKKIAKDSAIWFPRPKLRDRKKKIEKNRTIYKSRNETEDREAKPQERQKVKKIDLCQNCHDKLLAQ